MLLFRVFAADVFKLDSMATEGQGAKMLEINSLSSLDAIQLDCSLYDTPNGWWFREKLGKSR